jgi:hypothetical protein
MCSIVAPPVYLPTVNFMCSIVAPPVYLPTVNFMNHRYGRHGPRAWLKWRERHSVHSDTSPAPVARTTVYVYDLSITERIIYIVTTSPRDYQEGNGGLLQTPAFSRAPLSLQSGEKTSELSPGDVELIEAAQVQAINDAETLQSIDRDGQTISIHRVRVSDRARKLAQKDVLDHLTKIGRRKPDEYKRLLDVYQEAYVRQLDKEIETAPNIKYINDPQEAHLREMAFRDREEASSLGYGDWHIRDLAVIRVLQELGIPLDRAKESLAEMHPFVDKYQGYYSSQAKEVEWPFPEDFRN